LSANQAATTNRPFTFRFDSDLHEYVNDITGDVYPHITGLLKAAGEVDDRFFTDDSRIRGHYVHSLTAQYDLGAIDDLMELESPYAGWLAAYGDKKKGAIAVIQPKWRAVEEPIVHPRLRFGGRPDRWGTIYCAIGNVELKSGDPMDYHPIQTALQNILIETVCGLPAETIPRYGLYLKRTGRWHLQSFPNVRRDFQKAREIIKRFA
jgi:hypothetical protein